MHGVRPYCLSIAGFDPSAGAGVMADIKTFERLKAYGLGVVSALTYQNDSSFAGIQWQSIESISRQIEPLLKYDVRAVKIGLIENFQMLESVVEIVKGFFSHAFLIWDPIIKASTGFRFHENTGVNADSIEKLDLVTPNYHEYQQLSLESYSGNSSILLKGGHNPDKPGTDILLSNGKSTEIEGQPFDKSVTKHGTGCVLSAAIAACITNGDDLLLACSKAKKYVEHFMQSNTSNLGYHYE